MTDTTHQQAMTVAQEDRSDADLLRLIAKDYARLAPNAYHSAETLMQIADRLASVSSASADWTRTKAFDEAAAECMRAAEASTFADTVSEDERNGHRSACNLLAMNFRMMASRAAPEWPAPEPVPATNQAGEVAAWKARARSAANSVDALLLYATAYATDSDALDAYALLIQLRSELGMRGQPRTVDTFARNAAGRSVMPPLPALATQPATSQSDHQMQRVTSCVEQYRNAPFRTCDWLAGELMKICETAPDNDTATQPATSQEGEDKGNHDCLAKRRPGEPMFILLGRDPDAWQIVRAWAARRLNAGGDPEHCLLGMKTANAMREYTADPANRPASAPPADAYPRLAATPTPPTLSEDLREILASLPAGVVGVLKSDRFKPEGWELPVPSSNPLIRKLVDSGLFRLSDSRCGFEAVKEGWIKPTPAGLIARAALARAQVSA